MAGAHTGALLKELRPVAYREIAEQLAIPWPHRSNRKLARDYGVSGNTIKAIEKAEAEPIAHAKARLLRSSLRIAQQAANRVEDTLDTAGCSQAAMVGGIYTDKAMLLAGEPTQHIAISLNAQDLVSELRQVQAEIIEAVSVQPSTVPVLELTDSPSVNIP